MASRAALAMLRTTPRDQSVIRLFSELRYLTAAQVRQACFPSASVTTTSHRLTALRRRGLLACLTHRTFDDRRAFWCLAPLGRAAAATLLETAPPAPRADAVAALQMEHLIATNQLFCELCRLHRAGRLGGLRWHGSRHSGFDLGDVRVVPDAALVTVAPDGAVWMYCLELDRGTMSAEALAAKFARYRLVQRVAALRREEPAWDVRASSWILFACPDGERAAVAARLAGEYGLERFWAGTAADLPGGLSDAIGPSHAAAAEDAAGLRAGVIVPPGDGGCR